MGTKTAQIRPAMNSLEGTKVQSTLTRSAVKQAAAGVVHYSGLRRAFAAARRSTSGGRRVLIIGYHRVVPDLANCRALTQLTRARARR